MRRSGRSRAQGAAEAFLARYMVVLVLVALVVVYSALLPDTFPTFSTFRAIAATQAPLIIVSLGLLVPLAAGEFDLSIGSMAGFGSVLLAVLVGSHGWPIWAAIVSVFLSGVVVGVVNAIFIVRMGVNSFITTLGSGTVLASLTLAVSNSQVIAPNIPSLASATNDRLFGLPYIVYYSWMFVLIVWYVMEQTPIGRHVYVTGDAREVARLAGLRVGRIRVWSLITGSVIAALAGILLYGTIGSADPNGGAIFLLPAFSAVFLGAATITPGRVNAFGTLVAVYLLVVGITGLELMGYGGWVEGVFNGGALVLAVTFRELVTRRRRQ